MEPAICPNCGIEMCHEKILNEKKVGYRNTYKIIRFKCEVCDFVETKFGQGTVDAINTREAKNDINKMYKEQEDNNE